MKKYTNLYVACFVVSLALWGLWPDKWIWFRTATGLPVPFPVWTRPPVAFQAVGQLLGLT